MLSRFNHVAIVVPNLEAKKYKNILQANVSKLIIIKNMGLV